MSDENVTCPPELEGGPDEGFAGKSNVLKNDPKFQLDKKNWFCVFELNKFIKLPDSRMIQLRALVHLGNKVACKNPQTSLVPEDFA